MRVRSHVRCLKGAKKPLNLLGSLLLLPGEIAGLLSDARHRVATESGHYIQVEQPYLVTGAIRDVVEAVRGSASWRNSSQ